jgi:hypothetical protein
MHVSKRKNNESLDQTRTATIICMFGSQETQYAAWSPSTLLLIMPATL